MLTNDRRVLFDFCHHTKAEDPSTLEIDLDERLREDLKKAKHDYFDVVAFTHADVDHIKGSTDFFELQHAQKYQGGQRIKIRELWVPAAMVIEEAENHQRSDEFILLRQEARFRLLKGKDVRVFSKPPKLKEWLESKLKELGETANARDHLFVNAGTLVPGFTLGADSVEFFCHSPFIKHCEGGDIVRNSAALVFNVRFSAGSQRYDYLHVGDATWEVLEDIVQTTTSHKNNDRLAWDIFNIPHHCSYLALSDEKGAKETEPKPLIKELLLQGQRDAYIVSCSKPIPASKDAYDQVQPPHIQARTTYQRYLEKVNGRRFLVTMEEPNSSKPEPITFEISSGGVSWKRSAIVGAAAIITSTAPRAG